MKPVKHIKKFYDQIHRMNMDGHISTPDKYVAVKDLEISVHKLRTAFENSGEIEHEPSRPKQS